MRVRTDWTLVGLATVLLTACSSEPVANEANTVNAQQAQANLGGEAQLPNLTDNQTVAAGSGQSPCPNAPGIACSGPIIVRGEGFSLIVDGRHVSLQGSLVFENRTGGPIKVAILDFPVQARLDNGGMLHVFNSEGLGGITRCGRDGTACLQDTPDRFRALTPDESPLRVNSVLRGYNEGPLRASLPTVATAEITFQIYVVDSTNSGSALSISLPSVPVRNQASR